MTQHTTISEHNSVTQHTTISEHNSVTQHTTISEHNSVTQPTTISEHNSVTQPTTISEHNSVTQPTTISEHNSVTQHTTISEHNSVTQHTTISEHNSVTQHTTISEHNSVTQPTTISEHDSVTQPTTISEHNSVTQHTTISEHNSVTQHTTISEHNSVTQPTTISEHNSVTQPTTISEHNSVTQPTTISEHNSVTQHTTISEHNSVTQHTTISEHNSVTQPTTISEHNSVTQHTTISEHNSVTQPTTISEHNSVTQHTTISEHNSVTQPTTISEHNSVTQPTTISEHNSVTQPTTISEHNSVTQPTTISEHNSVTQPTTISEHNSVTQHTTISEHNSVTQPTTISEHNSVTQPTTISEHNSVTQPTTIPIFTSVIRKMINDKCIIVDKTSYYLKMVKERNSLFIARPSKFGKSVCISALKHIFMGDKHYFTGTNIYTSTYSWITRPVIHLDFSKMCCNSTQEFKLRLMDELNKIALYYNLEVKGRYLQSKLKQLIKGLSSINTVVILIDDYSSFTKSMHKYFENDIKSTIFKIFTVLESMATYIHFTLITGTEKSSLVSLFSAANKVEDITMNPAYAGLFGFTESEIRQYYSANVQKVANTWTCDKAHNKYIREHLPGKLNAKNCTFEDIIQYMIREYGGYRFTESDVTVLNPDSVIQFLNGKKPKYFWFKDAAPQCITKITNSNLYSIIRYKVQKDQLLKEHNLKKTDLTAILFQTGYLTIKNTEQNNFILHFPNSEALSSYNQFIHKKLIPVKEDNKVIGELRKNRFSHFFTFINNGYAMLKFPLISNAGENRYRLALIGMLCGILNSKNISVQSDGKSANVVNISFELSNGFYLLELKLQKSAQEALGQIQGKKYYHNYLNRGKSIFFIGINVSSTIRNISGWKVQCVSTTGKNMGIIEESQ